MQRFFLLTVLSLTIPLITCSDTRAGSLPSENVVVKYYHETGEVVVSLSNVLNWYIEDIDEKVLTGDTPTGLSRPNTLLTDNDVRIGSSSLSTFSVTDLHLGAIAQPNLADDGSFKIFWNSDYGQALNSTTIEFIGPNRSPTAELLAPSSIDIANAPLSVSFDASSSIDLDGDDISYHWDLNNDGVFEINSGTNSILAIEDVTTAFGGLGEYTVSVEVFDGEFRDTASVSLALIPTPPAPKPEPEPILPEEVPSVITEPAIDDVEIDATPVVNPGIASTTPTNFSNTEITRPDSTIDINILRSLLTDLPFHRLPATIPPATISTISLDTTSTLSETAILLGMNRLIVPDVQPLPIVINTGTLNWFDPAVETSVFAGISAPEPSSLLLALLGTIGIGLPRRK